MQQADLSQYAAGKPVQLHLRNRDAETFPSNISFKTHLGWGVPLRHL